MIGQIYYIDPQSGNDANSGMSPSEPLKTYAQRAFLGGDTVLFRRDSVIRDMLYTCNGAEDQYITYGAYGEGNKPVFLGSMPADGSEQWIEESPSIWRFTGTFPSEVCNIIFNDGESCGNLRWQIADLKIQGEWHYTLIGLTAESEAKKPDVIPGHEKGVLYIFSAGNPGHYYSSIECALWDSRRLAGGEHYVILEDLAFKNGGVHGYQEVCADHIKIQNCEFRFIGGGVWNRERKIRFGNAVEFWDGAHDIKVEGCVFSDIYDTGVTHQGSEQSDMPERIYFQNNLFINCGMAAYECRGPSAREIYFENNTCVNDGRGFAMQGELPPRTSEIYPQPMGHHVFIWRIDLHTQKGQVYIRNNIFYEAPFGAAIYSVIDIEDEQFLFIDNNCYWQTTGNLFALINGKSYSPSQFHQYQAESGHDQHSKLADPMFVNETEYDFRLKQGSPCIGMGIKAKG